MAVRSSDSRTSPLSVGRYPLIGRAGTGINDGYRARDPETDGLVTVYLFPNDSAAGARRVDRLSATFEVVSKLEHPNILRVTDFGTEGGFGYLVTEWVEGSTLARMIEVHSRLPENNVIRFLAQVGQAMDYARKDDLVPCRINPTNVLVRSDGVVKVIPFELPGNEETPPVAVPGLIKPQFAAKLAEEQARVKSFPFYELIFGMGTTLHEALTGMMWVPPSSPSSSRRRRPPPRPIGLTERTEKAIKKATDSDPTKRPASCAEFVKLLRGRPITAGTPKLDSRPPSSAGDNRRAYVRYALGTGANCTINSSVLEYDRPSTEIWPLVVQDVSLGGIGILLARRCEPGTELTVELMGGSDRSPRSLAVRVVRVRKDQYGHWMHGCEFFTPLEETELNALINYLGKAEVV